MVGIIQRQLRITRPRRFPKISNSSYAYENWGWKDVQSFANIGKKEKTTKDWFMYVLIATLAEDNHSHTVRPHNTIKIFIMKKDLAPDYGLCRFELQML